MFYGGLQVSKMKIFISILGEAHNLPLVLHIAPLEDKTSDSLKSTAQEARIN